MSNTDRDSMLERWATGMETLEQYYENLYGPPATPATLPYVTDTNGMLEAIADGLERARININKKSPTYHNTDTAYVKTVPTGDVQRASVEKLGGRTLVMNQLIHDGDFSAEDNTQYWKTQNNSSPLSFADGAATITFGGSYSVYNPAIAQIDIAKAIVDHKYYIKYDIQASFACNAYMRSDAFGDAAMGALTPNEWVTVRQIKTAKTDKSVWYYLSTGAGNPSAGATIKFKNVMVIDLTLMCGAGNEPKTVAECDDIIGSGYHDYNAGELYSAKPTGVVSKNSYGDVLETLSVPAGVQALAGYGWSCPGNYNYINFESKKYVQKVASREYASGDDTDNTVITDGTSTYYALTTPAETDISEYLTEDNLIAVEPGGTLTFVSQDDAHIPVPSTETFWVDIS